MSRTIDHQTSETGNNAVTFPVFLFGGRIFEAWLASKFEGAGNYLAAICLPMNDERGSGHRLFRSWYKARPFTILLQVVSSACRTCWLPD